MGRHALLPCLALAAALLAPLPGPAAADLAVPRNGPVAAGSVAIPDDSIIADGSFEGWSNPFTSGANRRTKVIWSDAAVHGTQLLRVSPRGKGPFGIDNWPGSVTDAVAHAPYRATAYVAGTGSLVGRSVTITARQVAEDGTTVAADVSRPVVLTKGFQKVQATLVPRTAGGHVDVYVSSGATDLRGALLVDAVSLTQGIPVPDGYAYADEVWRDRFGEAPDYDLTDSWTFGITDNKNGGQPWSGTGADPYFGSGTRGWAPACDYESLAAEYNLPEQVSQLSTWAPYNDFSDEGSGLRISIEPRVTVQNGCLYGWTSGAINTRGKREFGGGGKTVFIQVRAKMPYAEVDGQRVTNGTWGSIWLIPGAGSSQSNSVEVDLIEGGYLLEGADPLHVIASNLHTSAYQVVRDTGMDLSAGYHTYGAELDTVTGRVALFLDGQQYASYSNGPRSPMFLLLNAHVAHTTTEYWHSQVSDDTESSEMTVTEVRVFEKYDH